MSNGTPSSAVTEVIPRIANPANVRAPGQGVNPAANGSVVSPAAEGDSSSNVRRYRIGVIGAGARGETFARQLYSGHRRTELFGVCDLDADRLARFCEHCDLEGTPGFTDTTAFLNQGELDAVIITTPEFTHAEVAIAAMQAGKHIYLEKAMAQNSAECRRIIHAHRSSEVTAYLGFNLRAVAALTKLKEIVDSGVLGQLVHISGLEQLSAAHGAAFMRRYHRHSSRSGGLLNTKCSHDLDVLQWLIGHEHKVKRVSSFGGTNVFTPDKQPSKHCRNCPIQSQCPYCDRAGFVFPISGQEPIHHRQQEIYGGDLCVYDPDKDLVDNQTVILEWEHGVRGSFNLQLFQHVGRRQICLWGEGGYAELSTWPATSIRVIASQDGSTREYTFGHEAGGHGGSDAKMLDRFIDAIEYQTDNGSGLAAGLAATLLAEKADLSRLSGSVVEIAPDEFL
jgi:predicted dehydrogenase